MSQSLIEFPMATPKETAKVFSKLNGMKFAKGRKNLFMADRLLAFAVGESSAATIREWRQGKGVPNQDQLKQLQTLADEIEKLRDFEGDNTIKLFLCSVAVIDGPGKEGVTEIERLRLIRLGMFDVFRKEVRQFIANG